MKKDLMPSILDREIHSESKDAFGHRHFSSAIQSLVESLQNTPPFSIGLLGKWGSGKSSIKSMYLKTLADNRNNGEIYPITFNAWRYGGEDLKRALLRHVYLEAGGDKSSLDDALFNAIEETVKRPLKWNEIGREFYERFLWPSAQMLIVASCIGLVAYFTANALNLSNPWTSAIFVTGLTAFGWKLVEQLPELNKVLLSRTASVVRVDAPRSTAEQFEDLLVDQIKLFKKGKIKDGVGKKCERLVVFVDDLDRLSSEEMVAGLDAIRTFMEIPLDTTGVGIIFVISCDEDRIAEALYKNKATAKDMPGAVFSRTDARRYLDRIFQFRLEVPELPKRDMRSFAEQRLRDDAPEVVSELEESGVPLVNVIDRMIHVGVASPRNALQILNAFVQSWWIAKKREQVGPGTDRPGGLQKGAVTDHPISLAAISALRVDFPDFFHKLVIEPDLIERFSAVYIRGEKLEEQPESTRNMLSAYDDNDKEGELDAKHRPLKQFLNGLAGMRWPVSLKPLLILSQDPITRKHGDKAVPLYEAFVSADSDEVLRILGRDADYRSLDGSEVRLLKDMVEDLERETPVRRDNAAACLAQLADRLPKGEAHHLLSPLARRLAHSQSLRSRLGINKIRNVLPESMPEDRRDVAQKLTLDLLLLEGDTDFRLPSGQKPLLDDAISMVEQACDLILWVRDIDGLHSANDEQVLKWLELRRVSVEMKEGSLPFNVIESWAETYRGSLLPSLKDRYVHLVATELEADELPKDLVASALSKCKTVFDSLWGEGRDSQTILWGLATRLVATQNNQAVELAKSEVASHIDALSNNELSNFVIAFAQRLQKERESGWELGLESIRSAFISIIRNGQSNLNEIADESLESLANFWAGENPHGELACNVADVLVTRESERIDTIVADWSARLLTDLPVRCATWCARNFESRFTDQQKKQISKQLNQVVLNDSIPQDVADRYDVVMGEFPESAVQAAPLSNHLTQLCVQIQARPANPDEYLRKTFPVVAKVLKHCDDSASGEMLQAIFTGTRSQVPLYCFLHRQMAGRWIAASGSTGSYNPSQIFDESNQTATSSPSADEMDAVLNSLRSMHQAGIGPIDSGAKLIQLACKLWPHHRDASVIVLEESSETPTARNIADLISGIDVESSDELQSLAKLWSELASKGDKSLHTEVSTAFLSRPPNSQASTPDIGLRMWIDCIADQEEILLTLMFQGDLTDDQRKRIWLQVERRRSSLSKEFMLEVLPDLLKLPESRETTRAIIDSKDLLGEVFLTKDDKYNLGKVLLSSFLASPSVEDRNRLVEWIGGLGIDDVLKELSELGPISKQDRDVLTEAFPKSRFLKKVDLKAEDK